ncbi:MAG: discoidin domain-containing protein [Lentisphaerae bacterium]|nr:discoidin domain-containing protein [Lentisphaerota bacterium]
MKRLHSIIATTAAASLFLILFAPPATAQLDKFNYRLIPSTELTASASDTSYPAYPPANAVDGNVNSCARINDAPPGQWFQLDAGHIRMLAGMEIYSSNYRIQDYEIYVSDEADPIDWGTPVASGTLPNTTAWHPITFAPAYGRYLRLAVLSRYSAVTTYIYEVRLYESQFQLASLVTGHTGYANSNMVAIAAMPAMTGYDAYQITGSVAEPVSGWLAYDPDNPPIGVEVSLGTPAEGEAVTRYAWFKDEGNGVKPTTNAPATITFVRDSADVTASALASFSVPSWGNAARRGTADAAAVAAAVNRAVRRVADNATDGRRAADVATVAAVKNVTTARSGHTAGALALGGGDLAAVGAGGHIGGSIAHHTADIIGTADRAAIAAVRSSTPRHANHAADTVQATDLSVIDASQQCALGAASHTADHICANHAAISAAIRHHTV